MEKPKNQGKTGKPSKTGKKGKTKKPSINSASTGACYNTATGTLHVLLFRSTKSAPCGGHP